MFQTTYFKDIKNIIHEQDIEDIFNEKKIYSNNELKIIQTIIENISQYTYHSNKQYNVILKNQLVKYKGTLHKFPSKVELNIMYKKLIKSGLVNRNISLEKCMKKKFSRSGSGELPVTVFTSPSNFDCPEDCFYCPDEKKEVKMISKYGKEYTKKFRIQPRSYLSTEPGCRRAARDKFHPITQTYDRIHCLEIMGHEPDKIRFIVLGGTYCYYPMDYRIWFMTCLYYASNTYYNWNTNIDMLSLKEEMILNRDSNVRIVGISVETRPDRCSLDDCAHFMNCGITTVQIGIQQIDDSILKGINRNCSIEDIKKGTKRILDCGLKLDTHYMFDLPGPGKYCRLSPKQDKLMIDMITTHSDFAVADQWKLYPTATTPHTRILQWYKNMLEFMDKLKLKYNATIIQTRFRKYKKYEIKNILQQHIDLSKKKYLPYSEIDNGSYLIDIIVYAKQKVHKDTRLNRIIRDIPKCSIIGGNKVSNLRELAVQKIKNEKLKPCCCIRCREIQGGEFNIHTLKLDIYKRHKAGSDDYFISFEDSRGKLYGLARLRLLNQYSDCLPILTNSAVIREVHVYGATVKTKQQDITKPQHSGLGKRLVKKCEEIAINNGYRKIFITSGEGVIRYYENKLGYRLVENDYNGLTYHYMYKHLDNRTLYNLKKNNIVIILLVLLLFGFGYFSIKYNPL